MQRLVRPRPERHTTSLAQVDSCFLNSTQKFRVVLQPIFKSVGFGRKPLARSCSWQFPNQPEEVNLAPRLGDPAILDQTEPDRILLPSPIRQTKPLGHVNHRRAACYASRIAGRDTLARDNQRSTREASWFARRQDSEPLATSKRESPRFPRRLGAINSLRELVRARQDSNLRPPA
jgi:hypothetical protein